MTGTYLVTSGAAGVSRTATRQEVEAAYRLQVRRHHPDAGGDQDQFLRVKAAYENALMAVS